MADIKAKPGTYSCGSSGIGSTQHLACEAFALATGTKIVHVPYKGSSQALTDLVGGQIQLDFDTTSSAMSFIKGGKAKALAVMTAKRSPELPDVPTLAEAGVPGVEMSTWYGFFGPANLPREIAARLQAAAARALREPDVAERMGNLGMELRENGTEHYARFVREDLERYIGAVKTAGIKNE